MSPHVSSHEATSGWVIRRITLVIAIALGSLRGIAQTPDPQPPGVASDPARPPLNPFPAEQNWSFLLDASKRTDFFDRAKYIPFHDNPQCYLSFGLEYRIEYEYFDNWMFGAGPLDHTGPQRICAEPGYASFRFACGQVLTVLYRAKVRLYGGKEWRPEAGNHEDRGDVHQAFIEIGPPVSGEHGASLRVGRQEVVLGSGRLFDNAEGPNVKMSFDGLRLIAETSHLRLDLFAVKPVEDDPGFFDDMPHHQESLWGSYFTIPAPIAPHGQADLYYIGLDAKSASYNRGTAREIRHTGGVRIFRAVERGFGYNWEANYQWGSFGNDSIRAWSVATETGFTFDQTRFHPRPMLQADAYSGDGSPADHTLGTFDPLFPRGAFFTPKAIPFLGPQNLADLHPLIQFQLRTNITGEFSWNWYWRQSTQDGIYAFGNGIPIDSAGASRARYLGNQGDVEIRWAPVSHVILAFNMGRFKPGRFFDNVSYNRGPIVCNIGLTYRF